ncbi:unnamed protein product [Agarophyton chilense]
MDDPSNDTSGEEENPNESYVMISVDDQDSSAPALGPPGKRLKRNAQIEYNPFDWRKTLLVIKGRPTISSAFYVTCALGTLFVILSGVVGVPTEEDRVCRAWCSRLALGTQPHAYIGFILFLLMSFRTGQSYKNYVSGQKSFYQIQTRVRCFVHLFLDVIRREDVTKEHRARILAHVIAFPYALTADVRRDREFKEKGLENILTDDDMHQIRVSATRPLFVLETIGQMLQAYCGNLHPKMYYKLQGQILGLYTPYSEIERINTNPMGFAYVVHLRLLLMTYLTTLPLALVEQMGYSTIPVFWVIAYSLMSLEMLAVEVENPFGYQGSDLRLFTFHTFLRDTVMESWRWWLKDNAASHDNTGVEKGYENFGIEDDDHADAMSDLFCYW